MRYQEYDDGEFTLQDLKMYLSFTDTVAVYPGAGNNGSEAYFNELCYLGMGVLDEAAELQEILLDLSMPPEERFRKVRSECGDVLWYMLRLAKYCLFLDEEKIYNELFADQIVHGTYQSGMFLVCEVGKLTSLCKKSFRKSTILYDRQDECLEIMKRIISRLDLIYAANGLDTGLVISGNISKLGGRLESGTLADVDKRDDSL